MGGAFCPGFSAIGCAAFDTIVYDQLVGFGWDNVDLLVPVGGQFDRVGQAHYDRARVSRVLA